MPPTDRFVISFAAEPPQEALPYSRWADTLRDHFLSACREINADGEDLGEAGEIAWFPDRTYAGRTYVPAIARTGEGYELFGFVSFTEASGGPSGSSAVPAARWRSSSRYASAVERPKSASASTQ